MAFIQMNMISHSLHRTVPINAYIPCDPILMPDMEPPTGPWKTMYLLHGYTGSCFEWPECVNLNELSKQYNLAIILPDGENHFYVDAKRRNDMYGEFIGNELVDFTRMVFPLSHEREDTIIAGVSMGGYGAIRNGFKYSEVFGHIIGCSPAIIIDDINPGTKIATCTGTTSNDFYRSVFGTLEGMEETDLSPKWLAAQMVKEGKRFPDIFWGCGRNDLLVEPSRTLDKALTDLKVPHVYKEYPGTHDYTVFPGTLYDGLNRLLEKLPDPPNPFWIDG